MAAKARRVEYFFTTVKDRTGEGLQVLSQIAAANVNLLAFNAIPSGIETTQLVLFPEDAHQLIGAAEREGLVLHGPQRAFLIRGDDELGALAAVHRTLCDAGVNVYASSGVADGRGGFAYIVYVRAEDYEQAARVLEL